MANQSLMLTDDENALFNDSLERSVEAGMLDRFCEVFVNKPGVSIDILQGIDFEQQKRMLKSSPYFIMVASSERGGADPQLERIAAYHGRAGLKLPEFIFDHWLDSLVQAVSDTDPLFNADVEVAWRKIMHSGLSLMKRYAVSETHVESLG